MMAIGALALRFLPVAPLPQMDFPMITVTASLPGASPETMASSVATPLEQSLGAISGLAQMTSRSSEGSTRISLMFDLNRDINNAAREDRKSTRLNSSHVAISYAGFCLKK